jgi:hypothetical protein
MRKLSLAVLLGSLFAFIIGGGTAWADPPGNNGTVKIQEHGDFEGIPDNDPHVGCVFQIEFRGFDEGDLNATWDLAAQPPSGQFTHVLGGSTFIGGDPNGGANDVDSIVVVDLSTVDLSGLIEHPQQGFHLKLTVHADGSQGNDTKFKVFWVTGCPPYPVVQPDSAATAFGSPIPPARAPEPFPLALIAGIIGVLSVALFQPIRGLVKRRSTNER